MGLELLDWRRCVAALYAAVRAESDPSRAHHLWCDGRRQLFRDHPESPDRGADIRVAPYDGAWRFDVTVEAADPLRIEIATATDGVVPFERIGRVTLPPIGGLDVWWLASYGGGVWLPLRDANPATYGGGRYVLDTVKGADLGGAAGRLVVDLNFAYHPSCAYDEAWACPLAPEGNRTDVVVPVGELLPA
ncbi:MAG TPA: DUF1684 domain-containing protein [Mycobacteriales bacterium]|nr:DUF1684 domain-containing protein [Mycobacteriales bacterium]